MTSEDSGLPYLPHTNKDRQEMLSTIGAKSFEDLVSQIPKELRVKALNVKEGLSELELTKHIAELSLKNKPASRQSCFLGGGSYRRFVPAVVPQIVSRSEFATAYTPYQPEVSQGSLQAIYEFQSAICLLTGMDVANASMYDGPTACAEAGLMAARVTGRNKIVALRSVNPEYRMVTHAYAKACGLTWSVLDCQEGTASAADLALDSETAAIIVQYPNFFGCLEDLDEISEKAKSVGVLTIVVTDPINLAILTPPGDFGADIVVGDAQPCGNFLSFGGPSAGYMACRNEFVRQLPGRLAGITVDKNGQRAFTLTLQTREQHIRRAKATSNICTNQALNALSMLVYLTAMGKQGLPTIAEISLQRAHYLAEKLVKTSGVKLAFNKPFLNEFVIKVDVCVKSLLSTMKEKGILAGIDVANLYRETLELEGCILVAVTEMNSPAELDQYAEVLAESIAALQKDPKATEKSQKGDPTMAGKY